MVSRKFSVSLTPELAQALDRLAKERDEDRSSLMEILLRENPLVRDKVTSLRGVVNPGTKNGRDVEKLFALARLGKARWQQRVDDGTVRLG